MRRMDEQDLLKEFDLSGLPSRLEMRKYMSQYDLVNKDPFTGLGFQLLPSLPELTQDLPRKYIDLFLIGQPGKPHHRAEYLLIIGRNKFFQSLRGFVAGER